MNKNKMSAEKLLLENQALRNEIESLRKEQVDLGHFSSIIFEKKRTEQNLRKINDRLLQLGPSFDENVKLLTSLCGELSGADLTLYNRFTDGQLCSLGKWNATDFVEVGSEQHGHICFDLIKSQKNQMFVLGDLLHSSYAQTDPCILANNFNTYIGKAVVCDGEYVGVMCALFKKDVMITIDHEQIFTIVASALGNEESRNRTQQRLSESEEKFHSTFLVSPDSMCINRLADGVYLDVNQGFERITGFQREAVIGKTTSEINIWTHPDDRLHLLEMITKNGFVENMEAEFNTRSGTSINGLISARVFNIRGESVLLSVARDMTEKNRAIKALSDSEHKFRSVVENAFDGIYLVSGTRFIYANQRFCEIIGYSQEEIALPTFNLDVTLTDQSRELVEKRKHSRENGEEIPGIYEFEIQTRCGEIKEVEVSTVKIDDQENEVTVLGVMRDVTERKRLFEELLIAKKKAEEVNILKSRLLANLSHEIRTPLNGILGFAELLKEDSTDGAQKSMAEIIYTSGYRLLRTLNGILDLSVIESQFGNLRLKPVDLNPLIEEVVTLFQPATQKKGLFIKFFTTQDHIAVLADEELINKVLNNLINNAVKFTNTGGITVSTSVGSSDNSQIACIQVSDTGIGIKEKDQKVIFEEFRQVSEGQTRAYDGAGLGLHLSKRFAEMMNGTLSVQSDFAKGSTFTLCLPLSDH